jgi:hypothetical protein
MSQQPHGKGSVFGGFGDGSFTATIVDSGKTTWTGSITAMHLALLVAGPPLLLWLIWLMRASRTNNAGEATALGRPTRSELYSPDLRTETFDSSTSKREMREES